MHSLDIFRDREARPLGHFRQSAVLLLVQTINDEDHLILEKRALTLRAQPGDISFPGGRVEDGETPLAAAIRETCEEIGLKPEDIEIMGPLEYYVAHFGAVIYPFVARTHAADFALNPEEVSEILRIPLGYLLKQSPEIFPLQIEPTPPEDFPFDRIVGGRDYRFSSIRVDEYFYQWNDHHIWGTTARILFQFLSLLDPDHAPAEPKQK